MDRKEPRMPRVLRDFLLTAAVLAAASVLCALLRRIDSGGGFVSLLFVLAVAVVSRFSEGYFWGIFASVFSMVCVNYVFTYPYWEINFTMTGYPITFVTLLAVAVMISAMTTQIKRQERLRLETEKERMRADLLRAMSHDIRTPLTSIVGNTAALLENGGTFSREQERLLLQDVNEDAQWLIRMVENLLSITRISDEPGSIRTEYEAAEEIVGESVRKFQKRFPDAPVSVEVPEEVLLVPMDATLIQQVLLNLLENAVLHAGNAAQIRVSVRREGNLACFSVSDNGCGIPKDKLATIFSGAMSDPGTGGSDIKKNMGIGLSVCRTIVGAHGGAMSAENLKEGGARVCFSLPMKGENGYEDQG